MSLFKNTSLIVGVIVVIFCMAVFYRDGYKTGKNEGDTQIAILKSEWESQRRIELEQAQNRYQQQVTATSRLDAQYQQKLQQLEADNAQLQRNIASVTRRYVDAKGKIQPVSCVFTNGFVRQYNAAFGHSDNPAATTASRTGTTSGAAAAANSLLRDSGVSQRDVLAAATDAGHQCQRLAAQVNGLLDYIELQKEVTP